MLKLVVFFAGLLAGSVGSVSWLLSSNAPKSPAPPAMEGAVPLPSPPGTSTSLTDDLKARFETLKIRFQEARTEGERVGSKTERRLQGELEAYRKNPSRSKKTT